MRNESANVRNRVTRGLCLAQEKKKRRTPPRARNVFVLFSGLYQPGLLKRELAGSQKCYQKTKTLAADLREPLSFGFFFLAGPREPGSLKKALAESRAGCCDFFLFFELRWRVVSEICVAFLFAGFAQTQLAGAKPAG